jgi:hypothetical protein
MQPDIIGKIVDTHATYDENDEQVTAATYIDGWHVNLIKAEPEWAEYLCDPQPVTPQRIYAGGVMPVAYSFPNEETFKQHFPDLENTV